MAKTNKRYAPEFRRRMVELVRAGRKPAELSREFGPTPWSFHCGSSRKRVTWAKAMAGSPAKSLGAGSAAAGEPAAQGRT